jgi:hypothetical protein
VSNLGLFLVGTFVTLLVATSLVLLVWGAVLDGRDDRTERKRQADEARRETGVLRVVDAA